MSDPVRAYVVAAVAFGAWAAWRGGAPAWEVVASAVAGPVLLPVAVAVEVVAVVEERRR